MSSIVRYFISGVNHSIISAIADCQLIYVFQRAGVNHSIISAIADGPAYYMKDELGVNHSIISAIADVKSS